MASRSYRKQVFTLTTEWYTLLVPIDCNYFVIRNRGNETVEMDTGNSDGIDQLSPGGQDGVIVPMRDIAPRFSKDTELMRVRSLVNTSLVTVTYVK